MASERERALVTAAGLWGSLTSGVTLSSDGPTWPAAVASYGPVGHAVSAGDSAMAITTRDSLRFVVVPAPRPDGGLLPPSDAQVDALVARLRAVSRQVQDAPAPDAGRRAPGRAVRQDHVP